MQSPVKDLTFGPFKELRCGVAVPLLISLSTERAVDPAAAYLPLLKQLLNHLVTCHCVYCEFDENHTNNKVDV